MKISGEHRAGPAPERDGMVVVDHDVHKLLCVTKPHSYTLNSNSNLGETALRTTSQKPLHHQGPFVTTPGAPPSSHKSHSSALLDSASELGPHTRRDTGTERNRTHVHIRVTGHRISSHVSHHPSHLHPTIRNITRPSDPASSNLKP